MRLLSHNPKVSREHLLVIKQIVLFGRLKDFFPFDVIDVYDTTPGDAGLWITLEDGRRFLLTIASARPGATSEK